MFGPFGPKEYQVEGESEEAALEKCLEKIKILDDEAIKNFSGKPTENE